MFVVIDEDEARLTLPTVPQNLKCSSSKQVSAPPMELHVHKVLYDLLDALTVVTVTKEGRRNINYIFFINDFVLPSH